MAIRGNLDEDDQRDDSIDVLDADSDTVSYGLRPPRMKASNSTMMGARYDSGEGIDAYDEGTVFGGVAEESGYGPVEDDRINDQDNEEEIVAEMSMAYDGGTQPPVPVHRLRANGSKGRWPTNGPYSDSSAFSQGQRNGRGGGGGGRGGGGRGGGGGRRNGEWREDDMGNLSDRLAAQLGFDSAGRVRSRTTAARNGVRQEGASSIVPTRPRTNRMHGDMGAQAGYGRSNWASGTGRMPAGDPQYDEQDVANEAIEDIIEGDQQVREGEIDDEIDDEIEEEEKEQQQRYNDVGQSVGNLARARLSKTKPALKTKNDDPDKVASNKRLFIQIDSEGYETGSRFRSRYPIDAARKAISREVKDPSQGPKRVFLLSKDNGTVYRYEGGLQLVTDPTPFMVQHNIRYKPWVKSLGMLRVGPGGRVESASS